MPNWKKLIASGSDASLNSLNVNGGLTAGGTITANSFNGNFSGTIGNNLISANQLNVTGNGTTSQFLRSDGDGTFTWATPTNTNYFLNGITKSGNTLTFSVSGTTNRTYTFGSNAFTSYSNHVGLYDSIGTGAAEAAKVNARIDEEVLPAIPTNNNQLTNGAGYTTNVGDITGVTAGGGLSGGGTSGTVTLSHSDTSSQSSVNNSGRTYIQDITLDTYGHITGITSATETVVNTDTNTQRSDAEIRAVTSKQLVEGDNVTLSTEGETIVISSTDTNTTYSVGDGGLTQKNFTTTLFNKLNGIAASANNYSLPEATSTVRGGIELFSNTDQAVAANTVSATAGRTYGIQLNSAGQAVVNVPWSDTNTNTNYFLNGITKSGNTLTFSVSGTTNRTYTFGSNAFTSYSNHTGLYDSIGSAAAVNNRIDEEVLPAIPTNNNQLTNGAGYQTSTQVNTAIQKVVDAAPAALDTLNEIAASLNDDSDFAGTMTTALAGKLSTTGKAADSNLLDGLDLGGTRANVANKVVRTDSSGYLNAGWINTTSGNTLNTFTDFYVNTNDGYIRKATKAHVKSQLGLGSAAYVNTSAFDSAGTGAAEAAKINTRIDEEVLPAIPTNNNQLTNGAGYTTNTGTMSSWKIKEGNGTETSTVTNGETLTIAQGTGIESELTSTSSGGTLTITNTAPDQTVSLTGAGATSISGTYPNFTITSTDTNTDTNTQRSDEEIRDVAAAQWVNGSNTTVVKDDANNTIKINSVNTNTTYSAGTGLTLVGTQFRNAAPDQTVTLTGAGATTISGTYPNFTITSTDTNTDTNTWRPVDDTPRDGQTGVSISSNWAFDNVKTAVPANAKFTDTTYSVGDGGLTQKNFTTTLFNKLNGIAASANNYSHPGYTARSINTSGAAVLDILTVDSSGHVTAASTRNLTLANLGYTGATNANYITNNNQLSNGAGYLTSTNDRVYLTDSRGGFRLPSYYNDRYAQWDFQSSTDTGAKGDAWHGVLTVSKWSSFDATHRQEQLLFTGNDLKRRTALSDSEWGDVKTIWDNGNLNALTNATVSNDTITFTKSDGSTFAVTTSDANTNTNYYLNGITKSGNTLTFSVSGTTNRTYTFGSNAFNSTTIPTNNNQLTNGAGYITSYVNTQRSDEEIRAVTSKQLVEGPNVTLKDLGGTIEISSTDTNTNTTYSAGGGLTLSGTTFSHTDTSSQGSVNNSGRTYIQDITLDAYGHITGITSATETVVNTDTNTTYSADGNYGMTLSGTAFRLEDDRRRNSSTTDIYTGNTHDFTFYDASVGIRWYTAGSEDMRLLDNGTLHVDGDVVAYSTTVSDERLKDNVTTIQNPLDKIKALRGVEYDWNAGNRKGKRDLGLIAQEVEMVIPEIVHEHELPLIDGESDTIYKTVDYEKMVAVLIEGMKEQQSQIDELKSEISKLKGEA